MEALTFSGDIVLYLLGLAATWGAVMWRISALEKKVEKHNQVLERQYISENKISVLEEQVKVANHRITDLEDDIK